MSKIRMFFIYLIIGLLVLGILVFILTQVFAISVDIPDQGQMTLKQYSTCAMAYCSAGGKNPSGDASDEVRAVGCLKKNSLGVCEMTCEDVEEKIFSIVDKEKDNTGSFRDFASRPHYCGREYKLEFDFNDVTLGNAVTLRSGQMDNIASSPRWICKPLEIFGLNMDEALAAVPGFGVAGISTADWAYNGQILNMGVAPQNCLMLSKAQTDTATYANTGAFIASFFVGGPQTFAAGKVATQAAISGAKSSILSKLMTTGISFAAAPTVSVSKAAITKALISLPNKGAARTWLINGLSKGTVAAVGGSVIKDTNALGLANLKTRGGCFTGFVFDKLDDDAPSNEGLLYTPIVGYRTGDEWKKVYPSAIYVDQSFTEPRSGLEKAECDFINPAKASRSTGLTDDEFSGKIEDFKRDYISKHASDYDGAKIEIEYNDADGSPKTESRLLTREEIDEILKVDAEDAALSQFGSEDPIIGFDMTLQPFHFKTFDFGDMVSKCSFKTREDGEKVKYEVWSSPTYPGAGSLNERLKAGYDLESDEGYTFEYTDASGNKKEATLSASTIQNIGRFSLDNPYATPGNGVNDFSSDSLDILNSLGLDEATNDQEKKNNEVRAQTNAYTFFGSCAYVTLARADNSVFMEKISGSVPIDTAPTGADVQEPSQPQVSTVTGLTLDYVGREESKKFSPGDTINLFGKVSVDSGSAKGIDVKISVSLNGLPIESVAAVTSEDGSFKTTYLMKDAGDYHLLAGAGSHTTEESYSNWRDVSVK